MSDQFLAEIRIFTGNFAPVGWATCDGQLMPISQNTALFSLIGTFYGGNGTTNFALPNFEGRVPVDAGQGPGLSSYVVGVELGSDSETLTQGQMPSHSHSLNAEDPAIGSADQSVPTPTSTLASSTGGFAYRPDAASQPVPMNNSAISLQGGGHQHNNLQPYLTLTFCIALQGIFPARS